MSALAPVRGKIEIPKMSDERLQELCKRIRPVVRMARIRTTSKKNKGSSVTITSELHPSGKWEPWEYEGGEPYYIQPVDPRNIAFTWDPKQAEPATSLVALCDITTYHTFGYYGLFKPSIYECIAMIPEDILGQVVAFEIVESPKDWDDLNREEEALNQGFHVAKTKLYTSAPEE